MKYILTKEELDSLVPKEELDLAKEALQIARQIIKGQTEEKCPAYDCGDCVISSIGHDADIRLPDYAQSKLICTLPRNYHK